MVYTCDPRLTYSIINDSPDQTTYTIINHCQMTIIKTFQRKSTWNEKSRKIQPTTSTLHNSTIRVIVARTHMLRRSLQMTNLANGYNQHGQCNCTSISTVKLPHFQCKMVKITAKLPFSVQGSQNHSKVTIFSERQSESQQSYHISQCKTVKITAKLPFSVQDGQNHSKVTTFFSARWSKSQQSYHIFSARRSKSQ